MCETCYGNEVVYQFWKNDKRKEIDSDWLYCKECYPDSSGYWKEHINEDEWELISSTEFRELNEQKGYRDVTH